MILERSGSEAGLITTEGFRDLLHIARKKRPFNFSSHQDVPWQTRPLIRRRHRLTVQERIAGPDGRVITELDEDAVSVAAELLKSNGINSIAICFLFSFLNPDHERRATEIVRNVHPGAFISASHEVVPLYREFERFNTTAVNVYVGPRTSRYIESLLQALRAMRIAAPVRLMTSGGGMVTADAAIRLPVSLLMSGPAAGLLAGVRAGHGSGNRHVITLDVGGTSADIGVAPDGQVRMKHLLDTKIGECQVMIPMADIETIGAGGGSIASVSADGVLDVGPESAGAVPGPVCYGKGGTKPTVTDAVAALGWLRPETFFSGRLPLDVAAAQDAVRGLIAEPLSITPEMAALGVHRVVTQSIANSITQLSVRRGHDPRTFDLVAQGGAGPLFACSVAAEVGLARAVIPPCPGLASAFGLVSTDLRYEQVATIWQSSGSLDVGELRAAYQELLDAGRDQLSKDGVSPADMAYELYADCRYPSQGYELCIQAGQPPISESWLSALVRRFHDVHQATYLSRFDDREVQIVNVRVTAVGRVPHPAPVPARPLMNHVPVPAAEIQAWFAAGHSAVRSATAVYHRATLSPGARIRGPAIIEQPDSTIVIEPGFDAGVDVHGNVVITGAGGAR